MGLMDPKDQDAARKMDAFMAQGMLWHRDHEGCECGLEAAYRHYLSTHSKWISFERFVMAVEVMAGG